MYRFLILAVTVLSVAAFAQDISGTIGVAAQDSAYQVRYAANLNIGESWVNISNTGARGADINAGTAASVVGSICVNAYAFSPDEQMVSCCSCPVTPDGLVSLGANRDLISNTLTPAIPTSITIKLLATVPVGGSCNNSAASATAAIAPGMVVWGTTIHNAPPGVAAYQITETKSFPATLSAGERFRLNTLCNFILANGSGFGVCRACRLGALGGSRR